MCFEGPGCSRLPANSDQARGRSAPVAQLKDAFDLLDRDGDGTIKAEDLSSFLQHFFKDSPVSSEDIDHMIVLADSDGNGAVDFEEFLSLLQPHIPGKSETFSALGSEALRDMFRVLDSNGDGVLCSRDLSGVMGNLGQPLSSKDLMAMLEIATGSGWREVTFEDFCKLMNSTIAQ